ncbi:MAG: hypothetical protein Q8K34_19375 [Hydrogenophaga sp.]|nr:hypothetical protein [Hydrogenophaga sp.]
MQTDTLIALHAFLSEAERFSGVSERHLKTCPIKAQSTAMA